jgi:hypothetical protein
VRALIQNTWWGGTPSTYHQQKPHLFLSIAHTPEEIDKFVNDFEEFLVKNAELLAVR